STQAYQKSGGDTTMNYYLNQTKILEINRHHPLIKDSLCRIKDSKNDKTTFDFAHVMAEIAILRSGYHLEDSTDFAKCIESVLRRAVGISLDEKVEDESNDDDMNSK
ncbi:unnamed protein product, partial [Didymodactylos carnosus]